MGKEGKSFYFVKNVVSGSVWCLWFLVGLGAGWCCLPGTGPLELHLLPVGSEA